MNRFTLMATNSDKWEELVFLSLGSNLGNRLKNLERARKAINKCVGKIELVSSLYKTQAWGKENLNSFCNQVIGVSTNLFANKVLEYCQEIELELGRLPKKSSGYENRLIDIDLLIYGKQVLETNKLELPHPRMHLRNFVLVPFAEIAPEIQHPALNQSIENLKNNCLDCNKIERME